MTLHIVTGPPAAGKSTYVREHANPGDIRIDYDDLANLLTGLDPANHDHTAAAKAITKAARTAAIDTALTHANTTDVWIIHSTPSQATLDRYRAASAQIHTIDPGRDIVMNRIKTMRPAHMHAVAARWYDQHTPQPRRKTTAERGYDWKHEKNRARLLRSLKDGTPCWWCGIGMHRSKTANWDGQPLHADHETVLAKGGTTAGRLLHGFCNRQRYTGDHDHTRPAITGVHPRDWTPTPRQAPTGTQPVAVTFE